MPAQTMPATMPVRAGARRRGLVLLVAVVCLLAGAGRASGVSTGAGADATALGREDAQMDAAATQSRHDARAFEGTRSDAAGAGAAQRVHRFCASAFCVFCVSGGGGGDGARGGNPYSSRISVALLMWPCIATATPPRDASAKAPLFSPSPFRYGVSRVLAKETPG